MRIISSPLAFKKMHGLGNDFVVIDSRVRDFEATLPVVQGLADRHRGVGFDQLAVITQAGPHIHLAFYNADGSSSAACGNATRCIAAYLMNETGQSSITLATENGLLPAQKMSNGLVSVNMGQPQTDWADIPLSEQLDSLHLPLPGDPVATGMGNPHCTLFVEDVGAVDLSKSGRTIEHHPLFPQRTNVQYASLLSKNHLRMRVWERGVGITQASGSSSCATAVAAARRGLTERNVRITLDGGDIWINWADDGVWMTGATAHVFDGTLTQDFLASLT
jgi:diaminopimelate epimerase